MENIKLVKKRMSLPNFIRKTRFSSNSFVSYNSRIAQILEERQELVDKVIDEVVSGTFDKYSDCGSDLYVLLCGKITNEELRSSVNRPITLSKGTAVGRYLNNSFKKNVENYIRLYSEN